MARHSRWSTRSVNSRGESQQRRTGSLRRTAAVMGKVSLLHFNLLCREWPCGALACREHTQHTAPRCCTVRESVSHRPYEGLSPAFLALEAFKRHSRASRHQQGQVTKPALPLAQAVRTWSRRTGRAASRLFHRKPKSVLSQYCFSVLSKNTMYSWDPRSVSNAHRSRCALQTGGAKPGDRRPGYPAAA